ncbi:response regulator [Roseateles sp. BYS78W]|uniref:diguanylate cyclase n=1 Tax=Pelomonas candidula TaxID=3299025 RepID=A0ABW7HE61_9BURK
MTFRLPLHIAPAAPGPLAHRLDALLPPLGDARLLLVDDDPGQIQQLGRLLAGYTQLRFATSGEQALALAQGWQPELVLLDAEMPGLDGFEVCRRMKADPLLADVPIVFVTQHTDAAIEAAVFELGAADFIAKPVAGPALRARVAMQLRLRRTAQRLVRLARRDALTGLAERAQLDDELAQETRRARRNGQPLALLLAGVDDLAGYEQRHGRGATDNALRHVAGLAQQLLQRPADLAARHGDDVFALLLPDTTATGAATLATRLQQGLAAGDGLTLAIGIGLLTPEHDVAAAAETALAAARRAGPGSLFLADGAQAAAPYRP